CQQWSSNPPTWTF
nr:immunoglobulin light chain junction region [Mus musculus]NSL98041.1 immunoglobulin light chain junction region [Mus musculus]NSL98292.1 immunoglobulin light chain junction region [Mus musculus]NSL99294.1 immunoglobulin light chain junction region [Mus musculus]NSM00582.1 immunoglobulin light chain junction region [Mus musculus]